MEISPLKSYQNVAKWWAVPCQIPLPSAIASVHPFPHTQTHRPVPLSVNVMINAFIKTVNALRLNI